MYVFGYILIDIYVCVYSRAASETGRAGVSAMARRRAEKAAHTWYKFDTDAVFHAPMFALNADADASACGPSQPQSTPTEGARMWRGCVCAQSHTHTCTRPIAHAHMRAPAHGRSTWARACGGPASAICSSG